MRIRGRASLWLGSVALAASMAGGACSNNERPDDQALGLLPNSPASSPERGASRSVAISGGTLLIVDTRHVLVSDSDRDRLLLVNTDDGTKKTLDLAEADEPGRAVVDAEGDMHVVLRGADAIAKVSSGGTLLERTNVCRAPRGIAFNDATDTVEVACADGQLWSLDADSHQVVRKLQLDADLRDVISNGDRLLVSTLRSAELVAVEADGTISRRTAAARHAATEVPTVAWRTIGMPDGGALMVHQTAAGHSVELQPLPQDDVPNSANPYTSGTSGAPGVVSCEGALVTANTTRYDGEGRRLTPDGLSRLGLLPLPVDIAVSPSMEVAAVVSAGGNQVFEVNLADLESNPCKNLEDGGIPVQEPVAVAYQGTALLVQTRNPSRLLILSEGESTEVPLGGKDIDDQGHRDFHQTSGSIAAGLSCASCHPEGRDDGHTWLFDDAKVRSQTLRGHVLDNGALHWSGEFSSFRALSQEVAERRMASSVDSGKLERWIDGLPDLSASQTAQRGEFPSGGRLAFEKAGCDACHAGPRLTTEGTFDVGTGGKFVVPSLIGIRFRTPLMHDGCAPTISARFDPACGGDKHGDAQLLSDPELAQLISYLEGL